MNKNRIVSIILVALFAGLIFALVIIERINYQNSLSKKEKYDLVKDASEFFTIDDCANRYLTYLSDGDSKNLLAIMNEEYANDNNLNSSNIINRLDTHNFGDNVVSYKTRKMLMKKISDTVNEYYLYGEVYSDGIEDYYKMTDYYLIITLDSDTLVFDVKPYDGKVFKENK